MLKKRLALTTDRKITTCAPIGEVLCIGGISHANHQFDHESNKDFVDRITASGITIIPTLLTENKLKELSGPDYKDFTETSGVDHQIKEINEIEFDVEHIEMKVSLHGDIFIEYFNYSGDSITYLDNSMIKIHLNNLYDESNDIQVSEHGGEIDIESNKPLNFTKEQIRMIDKYGGASMNNGVLSIGGRNAETFNIKEAKKIDKDIASRNKP